ncbi:MAG: hypothetical protein HRT61_19525, partial [Ekhidna sp.]|nr:hypothetical protein [Ekhidna sp.]
MKSLRQVFLTSLAILAISSQKSFATDPFATQERTEFAFRALRDIINKEYIEKLNAATGDNYFSTAQPDQLPASREELDLYLQLNYKQAIEIAEEETINNVFA